MKDRTHATDARRREVLNSPLLRKSARHEKTPKSLRRREKMNLRKQWCPQSASRCILLTSLFQPHATTSRSA